MATEVRLLSVLFARRAENTSASLRHPMPAKTARRRVIGAIVTEIPVLWPTR